ncbi:DUF2182 domain-containing protein [Mesorhizobium sp. 10J20-29]
MARDVAETILRRDRQVVLAALAVVVVLAWAWLLAGSGTGMSMRAMTTAAFPPPAMRFDPQPWSPAHAAIMLAMWAVMMVAMMLPSAAPVILLYAHAWRGEQGRGRIAPGRPPVEAFVAGYLTVWTGFAVVATALQYGLERSGLVHGMLMWSTSPLLSAALLVAAGLYQVLPAKQACLVQCRSPAAVIAGRFRPGGLAAWRIGLGHGLFCLGCCWALMALLFVGGVMNLLWIAGLTLVIVAEKLLPAGQLLSRLFGALMILAGLGLGLAGLA